MLSCIENTIYNRVRVSLSEITQLLTLPLHGQSLDLR
jgi:hypothetical protein